MKSDGTLTDSELTKLFGKTGPSRHYFDADEAHAGVELHIGDQIRVTAYNSPSVLDRLWDDAQENAEEHIDQIVQEFVKRGILVRLDRVQGADITQPTDGAAREVYVYDMEIVDFPPPAAFQLELATFAGNVWAIAGLIAAVAALTITIKIATVSRSDLVESVDKVSSRAADAAFWISAAAIVVGLAYIIGKTGGTNATAASA